MRENTKEKILNRMFHDVFGKFTIVNFLIEENETLENAISSTINLLYVYQNLLNKQNNMIPLRKLAKEKEIDFQINDFHISFEKYIVLCFIVLSSLENILIIILQNQIIIQNSSLNPLIEIEDLLKQDDLLTENIKINEQENKIVIDFYSKSHLQIENIH
jgi:hypothetical protein